MEQLLELVALETLIRGVRETYPLKKTLCLTKQKLAQGEANNEKSHMSGRDRYAMT